MSPLVQAAQNRARQLIEPRMGYDAWVSRCHRDARFLSQGYRGPQWRPGAIERIEDDEARAVLAALAQALRNKEMMG